MGPEIQVFLPLSNLWYTLATVYLVVAGGSGVPAVVLWLSPGGTPGVEFQGWSTSSGTPLSGPLEF